MPEPTPQSVEQDEFHCDSCGSSTHDTIGHDLSPVRIGGMFLGDELRDRILAVLPAECFITRSKAARCTTWIGGTFDNGAEFSADLCCLPCRIRAEVDAVYPPASTPTGDNEGGVR